MRAVAGIILGAAALAVPAQAQDGGAERPAPGCAGVNFTDPRGDVENAGLDIVSGYLTTKGDAVFANLVVSDLDRTVDQADMAVEWFVAGWTTDDGSDRAAAHLRADGSTDGGTFFEGTNGVVQLQLPGVRPDTPVRLWASSGADRDPLVAAPPGGDPRVSVFVLGESAEEIEGNVQAASCPAAPGEPAAAAEPGEGEQRTAAAPSGVELLSTRVSGRTVRLRLRSAVATPVKATLSRGSRVLARGSARVEGTGRLVLNARRALRPGTYTLRVTGVAPRQVRVLR